MITEDYVSFETAKLLKEKGFNEGCPTTYTSNGFFHTHNYKPLFDDIFAPTLQMAMKWLRKTHHIHIRLINSTDEDYRYEIYPIKGKYRGSYFSDNCYYEYEDACEVAIKFCLEKII